MTPPPGSLGTMPCPAEGFLSATWDWRNRLVRTLLERAAG